MNPYTTQVLTIIGAIAAGILAYSLPIIGCTLLPYITVKEKPNPNVMAWTMISSGCLGWIAFFLYSVLH